MSRFKKTCFIWWMVIGLLTVSVVSGQQDNILETTSLESTLRNRFHLTKRELTSLKPILKRENAELIVVLDRCMDADRPGHLDFWNRLRILRQDFESVSLIGLTQRQKHAMRDLRSEFELRISDIWQEFYLDYLTSILDLSWIQTNLIEKFLERDNQLRMAFLVTDTKMSDEATRVWEKLSTELDKQIEDSLTPDQKADYREMKVKGNRLVV